MKKYLFLLLVVSFVIAGCAKNPADYFPMNVGNKWDYNFKMTDAHGTVTNLMMTYSITEKTKLGESEYYKFESEFSGAPKGTSKQVDYYRLSPAGIVIRGSDPKNTDELVVLPFDLKVGTDWTATYPSSKRHFKVTAFEDLAIGDNKYKDCIKVEYEDLGAYEANSGYFYFAKNIGLVKVFTKVEKVDGSSTSSEATLAKYTE